MLPMLPMRRWLDTVTIPNREGARVRVLLTDGGTRETEVMRGADGLHRLKDIEIARVVGWEFVRGGRHDLDR